MEGAARVLIVVLLAVAGITVEGGGEKRMPPCIGDLSPCLPAITNPVVKLLPGSDCCVAVKNALRREKECLCSVFNTSSSPSSFFGPTFPIDSMSRALAIPSVCGISLADISKCDDDGPTFPTSTPSATSESSASSSPRHMNRVESASSRSSSTPSSEPSSSPPSGSYGKSSAGRAKNAVKLWLATLTLFLFATSFMLVP